MYPQMTMLEIDRTTIREYALFQRAFLLQQLDKRYIAAYQAWLSTLAQSTKKNGEPAYRKFEQLFDYEKERERILHPWAEEEGLNDRTKAALQKMKQLNEMR